MADHDPNSPDNYRKYPLVMFLANTRNGKTDDSGCSNSKKKLTDNNVFLALQQMGFSEPEAVAAWKWSNSFFQS
jgi:hypothetical protein